MSTLVEVVLINSFWSPAGLDGSKMDFLKMRSKIVWVVIFIVLVFARVTNGTNPYEDVIRQLHSKFTNYNKDLR